LEKRQHGGECMGAHGGDRLAWGLVHGRGTCGHHSDDDDDDDDDAGHFVELTNAGIWRTWGQSHH